MAMQRAHRQTALTDVPSSTSAQGATLDAQSLQGNQAMLDALQGQDTGPAPADFITMTGGTMAPLDTGSDMGKDLAEGMTELNKSPALAAAGGEGGGDYNVGYRPSLEQAKAERDALVKAMLAEKDLAKRKKEYGADFTTANAQVATAEDWANGHTDDGTAFFTRPNPLESERFSWKLARDVSASEALDVWLAGETIADCASAIVALQLNALRNKLGDAAFDKLCSGSGYTMEFFICPNPMKTPLQYALSAIDLYKSEDKGEVGARPGLQVGDAVYFQNHPDYIKYDPSGLWSGENCVYMGEVNGEQTFAGFGVTGRTELQMNQAIVKHFNDVAPPSATIDVDGLAKAGGGLQTGLGKNERVNPAGTRLDEGKVGELATKLR